MVVKWRRLMVSFQVSKKNLLLYVVFLTCSLLGVIPALHLQSQVLLLSSGQTEVEDSPGTNNTYWQQPLIRVEVLNDKDKDDDEDSDDWWLYRVDTAHLNHPHLGARHPNGTLGMVVNPSVKRLGPPKTPREILHSFTPPGVLCPTTHHPKSSAYGIEGRGGNQVLHKIRQGLIEARRELAKNTTKKVRILCMLYTVYTPDDKHASLTSVVETWGKDCDGFIGASNVTDHTIGAIDLVHQGPEEYKNMWQKIRSVWTYAYDHYLNDYDFFYIAGDDCFVLVDHLRFYLTSSELQRLEEGYLDRVSKFHFEEARITAQWRPRPLVLGTPLHFKAKPNIAGGAGYVLNQAALRLWGENGINMWMPDAHDSREDILMSSFFMNQSVYLTDTQDQAGGWRFSRSAQATFDFNGKNSPIGPEALKRRYGFHNGIGPDLVSKHQLAFHLKNDKKRLKAQGLSVRHLMYRYHAFFHSWCGASDEMNVTGVN